MKLAITRLEAQTLFPSISPASRNHTVSKTSAAAPDRKKIKLEGQCHVLPIGARAAYASTRSKTRRVHASETHA